MIPARAAERTAAAAGAVALAALLAAAFAPAPRALASPGMIAAAWAAAAAGLSYLRLRAYRRSEEEKRDRAGSAAESGGGALFENADEEDLFSAARTLRWLERWITPGFAPLAGAVLLALGIQQIRAVQSGIVALSLESAAFPAAGLLAAAAFVAALAARFAAVFARAPGHAPLRAPASALALSAALLAIAAVALAAAGSDVDGALRMGALAASAGLAVIGTECLLSSVARFYRPPAAKPEAGLAARFDSPLGLALADPSRALRPAAESVDYQLGFRASQTWWYRFAVRALLPLAVFQILVLYGLSCIVVIGPEEAGILERLGRPLPDAAGGRLEPGLHLKAPWPFETVCRFPVERLQRFDAGFTLEGGEMPREMLWARPHFRQEDRFLTPSRDAGPGGAAPVNLLAVNLPVLYQVTDLRAWLYGHREPAALLRELAYRAVTREAAGRELDDILGPGQRAFEAALRDRLQRDAHAMNLGVEIRYVGLNGVHPPVPVVADYEGVSGALEERDAQRLDGEAYAASRVPQADAEAEKRLAAAAGDAARRSATARAEADAFELRRKADQEAPGVYRGHAYLTALARSLRGARLYVVATPADQEMIQFNFEDRTPSSLFDWSASAPAAGAAGPTGAADATGGGR